MKDEYKDYEDALKQTRIQSLEERREQLSLRFVKKSLKNLTFSKLFPLKSSKHVMSVRNPLKYQINKANTERYKNSAIPYLQRLLNREHLKRKADFKELETSVSKKIRINNSLVNYVSCANPIT